MDKRTKPLQDAAKCLLKDVNSAIGKKLILNKEEKVIFYYIWIYENIGKTEI
jgi:hypothetical protein